MYIRIKKNPDGSHAFQSGGNLEDGWAVIPHNMDIPSTFPFVDIEVDNVTTPSVDGNGDITRLEVVSMTEGKMIEVNKAEYISRLDIIEAQLAYVAMITDALLEV